MLGSLANGCDGVPDSSKCFKRGVYVEAIALNEETLLSPLRTFGNKTDRMELSYNSNKAVAVQQDIGLSLLQYDQSCWNILKLIDFSMYIHWLD